MIIDFIARHWLIIGILAYYAALSYRSHCRRLTAKLDRRNDSDWAAQEYLSATLQSVWQQGYAQGQHNALRRAADDRAA